jgi:hypothetical protein
VQGAKSNISKLIEKLHTKANTKANGMIKNAWKNHACLVKEGIHENE